MSRKTGNAQFRATFFRHSAVLSLTAALLSKLPIETIWEHAPMILHSQGIFQPLGAFFEKSWIHP